MAERSNGFDSYQDNGAQRSYRRFPRQNQPLRSDNSQPNDYRRNRYPESHHSDFPENNQHNYSAQQRSGYSEGHQRNRYPERDQRERVPETHQRERYHDVGQQRDRYPQSHHSGFRESSQNNYDTHQRHDHEYLSDDRSFSSDCRYETNNRRNGYRQSDSNNHRGRQARSKLQNGNRQNVVDDSKDSCKEIAVGPKLPLANGVNVTQATSLRQQIESNTHECMVCYETINAFCATHSCFQCHNIFHLSCVRQWANSKMSDTTVENPCWTCPACQVESNVVPYRYHCFCGAFINPAFQPFILPHSCGEKCSRLRDNCSHACPDLCHPGKCPPCGAFVIVYCECRNESKRMKCSQKDSGFQCSKSCGKLLNCGKHHCDLVCHSGGCDPCKISNTLDCYCSKSSKELSCGKEKLHVQTNHTGYWSCYEKCNQPLSCGNHLCEVKCHPGPCSPCATDSRTVTTCPCGGTKLGKLTSISRESCLDDIATCRKICRKYLQCGNDSDSLHICQAMCHNGSCPPCTERSLVTCNCGSSTESMMCSDIPEGGLCCERICYKKKSCGRHRCNTKCCQEDDHICMIPCGKLLSCKLHKCEELCHRGHCMPCLMSNFSEVYCSCGRTKIDPPVACGTLPPKCNEPCSRDHPCPHPVTHTCHYEEECPPCSQLVNKLCMGGHSVRFAVPCHIEDVSCGEVCKKTLPCGLHECERWCHRGECVPENTTCQLPCAKKRTKCDHNCSSKCHPEQPCPNTVCFEKIKVSCRCSRRTVALLCFGGAVTNPQNIELGKFNTKLKRVHLSIKQQDLMVYLTEKVIPCVEQCLLEDRNQRLAEALGLKEVAVDNVIAPTYTEYLKGEIKKNKDFIVEIENQFSELISKYKKRNSGMDNLNKVKFIYHDFSTMNKDKRRTIHELAGFYKITTQSFEAEPQRSVQIRIAYDACEPTVKLSKMAQRKVIAGNGLSKSNSRVPSDGESMPKLQSLGRGGAFSKEEIVFDNWEDLSED